ncbi:MSHA biogenesis protein MshK [Vibrio sp. SCSIO 43137]|uniref:MSHA biogenesis protein MshK n=1 Tax=Vibrio sp. SCSIO 43137 TaxID=3021011 RepID=UPI00230774C4|nr:MSHA biogenesis protein MshK [Vibrio sp. SCSIO 43137]WCE29999.1 MSHA biogenesis protein MshK [Vibrio sp. SCSIO 43137]
MAKKQLFAYLSLLITVNAFAADDPTAPLGWVQPKAQVKSQKHVKSKLPQLQSIVCRGNSACYAILDNKIVESGQSIAGYKVEKITSEQVTIAKGSKQWHLALFALNIKK